MNTAKWTTQLQELTAAFHNAFSPLQEAALNQKPTANTWSIAQNIDHLIVVNESYFPDLDCLLAGQYKQPFLGRFNFITRFFGNFILKAVDPDRKKKMKTFSVWQPSNSQLPADLLNRFVMHQQELERRISSSQTLVDEGAVIASPANKNIVYKLDAAFDILVTHEKRHLLQAKEVLSSLQKQTYRELS